MATWQKTIFINNDEAEFIRQALGGWRLMNEDDVTTHTAIFPDGTEMDIKCVGRQADFEEEENSEEYGNQPSWTEAVLFRNGAKIACSEPDDFYLGLWSLSDGNGNINNVRVAEAMSSN